MPFSRIWHCPVTLRVRTCRIEIPSSNLIHVFNPNRRWVGQTTVTECPYDKKYRIRSDIGQEFFNQKYISKEIAEKICKEIEEIT